MPIDEKVTAVVLRDDAVQSGAVVRIGVDGNKWKAQLSTGDRELDRARAFDSLDVAKRWGTLAVEVGNQLLALSAKYRAKLAEIAATLDEPLGEPAPADRPPQRGRPRQGGR